MSETWQVLRDTEGLTHLPDDEGRPACGTERDVKPLQHPVDAAALWCTGCLQNAALTDG